MNWTSAPSIVDAPPEPARRPFSRALTRAALDRLERFLEAERSQLPLWFVAMAGLGIAAWFALGTAGAWAGVILVGIAAAGLGLAVGLGRRTGRALMIAGLAASLGCGWAWLRADLAASPRLERPTVARFAARVERVDPLPARGKLRLLLAPLQAPGLPPRVRVSMSDRDPPAGLAPGALVVVRARLQPPPPMALPGTHDFARDAWFARTGAVGIALGPVSVDRAGGSAGLNSLRSRLGAHIRAELPGSAGGIATALATGDQAAVSEDDAEAMRRSGLTHLLSVSGLHIAAVVAAAMLLSLRLLALSERLALRFNLVVVAAGVGALAGIAYTLLTGMQVPTVRSCIAAVLVLLGIAMGRESISLRLVAVGALAVMAFRPEALAGASFQMSFAAVTAIVVLHNSPRMRRWLTPREEPIWARLGRGVLGLLATGLAVELALVPIALFHFHRSGLYGVAANLIAIPLTTFVIMPLEALALVADAVGLGAPMWWLAGRSIDFLLWLAHRVGESPGAVTMLPSMPRAAYAAMIAGGLWFALWAGRVRYAGIPLAAAGALAAVAAPVPDLLVTGDGRHLALVRADGRPVLLRERAGDYVRDLLAEVAAYDGDPLALDGQPFAHCSKDACVADLTEDGRSWRLLAIRGKDLLAWNQFVAACAEADIVVASRRLPRGCYPRWMKLDREALAASGGVAIYLGDRPRVASVAERVGDHPWKSSPPPPYRPRAADAAAPSPRSTPPVRFPPDR